MIIELAGGVLMEQAQLTRVSLLFKALADPARLRILGLLAERPRAGHEIAASLALTPPTVSHHMRRLTEAGLVHVSPEAQTRIYTLNTEPFHDASRSMDDEHSSTRSSQEDDAVIRAFFAGPRLRQIPASRKKRVIVLRRLLERFEIGREYQEKEVNQILREAHDDHATLRRELVDYGFMTRDKGIYRVATELPGRGATVAQEVGDETNWLAELVTNATTRAVSTSSVTNGTHPLPRE
jgi:hypothetical protein